MHYQNILLAAILVPFVAAHGKIAVVQGDAGGNGTALAIQGAVVPGAGDNSVTEVDTTVFKSTKLRTDGLGRTTGTGKNKVEMLTKAMALSGNTLPQVSANGGKITGTVHIVTTDGAGPYHAMIDPTATGKFSKGVRAHVVQQVPGKKGNIQPDGTVKARHLTGRALEKRATNVNKDFPITINVPAGTTCTGTAAGQENVCLMKISNGSGNGPFGGVIAFQMAASGTADTGKATVQNADGCGTAAAAAAAAAKRDVTTDEDEEDEEDY